MVAFALVVSTVLKGLFDYVGTYLVNYAGFGMITDLRNELYTATLRRSVAFFQQVLHRNAVVGHRQRHRKRAVRHVHACWRNSCSSSSPSCSPLRW